MGETYPGQDCQHRTCAVLYYHEPKPRNGSQPGVSGGKSGTKHYDEKTTAERLEYFHSILEFEEKALGKGKTAMEILKRVAGHQAYREYHFLKDIAKFNSVGDFRGMVANKTAKIAHLYLGKGAGRLGQARGVFEHMTNFVAFAQEAVTSFENVKRIIESSDDVQTKQSKLSFEAAAMGARYIYQADMALVGPTVSTLRFFGRPLQALGYGAFSSRADKIEAVQKHLDTWVKSHVNGEEIYTVFTHSVTIMER